MLRTTFSSMITYRWWIALWSALAILTTVWTAAAERSPSAPPVGLPSFASSPPEAAASVHVSGFDISAVHASASGLYVDVVVSVEGNPGAGDNLLFTPGPILAWPTGEQSKLISGSNDGRLMSLRFVREGTSPAMPGEKLTLMLYGVTSREHATVPAAVPVLPSALSVLLDEATNGTSVSLGDSRLVIGNGNVVLDELRTDAGMMRVAGHFEGISREDVTALSVRGSRLSTAGDGSLSPSSIRAGYGPQGMNFHLDFALADGDATLLQFSVSIAPNAAEPPPSAAIGALESFPKELDLDLRAYHR